MLGRIKTYIHDHLHRFPGYKEIVHHSLTFPKKEGEITLEEARFLGGLVQAAPAGRPIVEIGSLFGSSTRILALYKAPATKVFAVDNFCWNPLKLSNDEHYALTRDMLKELIEKDNVELIRADKAEFYKSYNGPAPGLVFLDAWHTYEETKKDIEWAQSVGAEIICGHDHGPLFPGVIQAAEECGGTEAVVGAVFQMKRKTV